MSYKKINNLTGWAVFLISAIVYILTMEPHGSLWDCGEFAGSAARLGVPHPPGAPLFVIIGRIFTIIGKAIGIGEGGGVALMSALSSAFTILFLFWTITHFARKIKNKNNNEPSKGTTFDIMAAGVVGALAYTFSDSFWYSAVESEVYAMSSLCTAVVFWAALKWEDHPLNNEASGADGKAAADKWMILIFFLMGMSIGVHLLNILTIPPILLIYYFKRYKSTNKGMLIALFVSILILGFVQKFVGQWSIAMAFPFERLFVGFGLPVLSGFVFFFVLLGVAIYFGLRFANKNQYSTMRLALWCFAFTFIGMSTYMTTMIRARANPGIDMYNVDNPYALKGYLSREQYGDFPLLYGQTYEANPINSHKTDDKYILRKDENGKLNYIKVGENRDLEYANEDKMLLPRIWYGNEENRKSFYKQWLNPKSEVVEMVYRPDEASGQYKVVSQSVSEIVDNEQEAKQKVQQANAMVQASNEAASKKGSDILQYTSKDHLTQKENLQWLFSYQINWMYWRYFMWNFVGKQNDIQGFSSKRDGNWISGISFLDNWRLGDQNAMPDALKNNKSHNRLFFLPFILGLIGMCYQIVRKKVDKNVGFFNLLGRFHEDGIITMLLFLMTGLAIVGYLNQYGLQPRERDYAYVGSFYAFAIWIGLGVLQIRDWFAKFTKGLTPSFIAAALCFVAVPALMCNQEWDDHDRSQKRLARDLAIDYLESCPKDAILFTIGDNDTYPLWYAQEVEGIRKDIRVVNTSLLGIDWYLDQLLYKVNESAPFKMIWKSSDYEGPKMEVAYDGKSDDNKLFSLDSLITQSVKISETSQEDRAYFAGRNYYLNVDVNKASKIFNLAPTDTLLPRITSVINKGKSYLSKGDFGILNIISANVNDRPICFTDDNGAELGGLGVQPYLRREGMVYRFVPSTNFKKIETERSKKIMEEKFAWGNAKAKGVYFDEENRRHLESIRTTYVTVGQELAIEEKFDDAKKILRKVHTEIPSYSLPYGSPSRMEGNNNTSLSMVQAAFLAKDDALGKEIYNEVSKDIDQQLKYYYVLSNPNGNPTKENIALMVKDFEKMNQIENKSRSGGITKEENDEHDRLEKNIFKNNLSSSFTISDFYSNMRNYSFMNRLKDTYIEPKPATPEPTKTPVEKVPSAVKVQMVPKKDSPAKTP